MLKQENLAKNGIILILAVMVVIVTTYKAGAVVMFSVALAARIVLELLVIRVVRAGEAAEHVMGVA